MSINYVTSVIARINDAESCIVMYLFLARCLFYFTEWQVLHHTGQKLVQLSMRVTGDIGGSMGLLIGASVITLMEAVDAFANTLASRRCKGKGDHGDHRKQSRRMNSKICVQESIHM